MRHILATLATLLQAYVLDDVVSTHNDIHNKRLIDSIDAINQAQQFLGPQV